MNQFTLQSLNWVVKNLSGILKSPQISNALDFKRLNKGRILWSPWGKIQKGYCRSQGGRKLPGGFSCSPGAVSKINLGRGNMHMYDDMEAQTGCHLTLEWMFIVFLCVYNFSRIFIAVEAVRI